MQANMLRGPLTRFGFAVTAIACLIDQASKLYLLQVAGLADRPIRLGPCRAAGREQRRPEQTAERET